MALAPCPDCGLRPRYLVNGRWLTLDKIMTLRLAPSSIKIRPQHSWHCPSEDNRLRHFLRSSKS